MSNWLKTAWALWRVFSFVKKTKKEEKKDVEVVAPPTIPESEAGFLWTDLVWQGPHFLRSDDNVAPILKSARVTAGGEGMVHFDHTSYDWPSTTMGSAVVDAIAVILWKSSGVWHASKFDWIRKGGQSDKTLKNITHDHYNGLQPLPGGTECGFAWVGINNDRRTNVVFTVWP